MPPHITRHVCANIAHTLNQLITPSAPILGLLGDIGNPALPTYRDFLYHQATRFKLVLVLAGNHEYYSPSSAPPHPTMGTLYSARLAPTSTVLICSLTMQVSSTRPFTTSALLPHARTSCILIRGW